LLISIEFSKLLAWFFCQSEYNQDQAKSQENFQSQFNYWSEDGQKFSGKIGHSIVRLTFGFLSGWSVMQNVKRPDR